MTLKTLSGSEFEKQLFASIVDQRCDRSIVDALLPDGKPFAYETSLWDYKRKFPVTTGRIDKSVVEQDESALAEFIKDIVSFYNTFGGYILGGVAEGESQIIGCDAIKDGSFQLDKLNDKIQSYTKQRIECRFVSLAFGQEKIGLGLLFIPRRADYAPIARMARGAPEIKGKSAFKKHDIYGRLNDKSTPARVERNLLPLLCSKRLYNISNDQKILENSLPQRDPNLIRFVGREVYLANLWSWMVDRHASVKVLTALGGTGKTAIAYEFCQQIISSSPNQIDKVVWLSAKRQFYSAFKGKYQEASRVDFFDLTSCIEAICKQLGSTEQDITECGSDMDDLIDLMINSLNVFPSLVVIDDIDTLNIDAQNDLFSTINQVSGRVFDKGTRFLFTSRLDFGAENQRLEISGFEEKEFIEYLQMMAKERNVPLPKGIEIQIFKASLGSPIFATSMLSLAGLGIDIFRAVKEWKGKEGEQVRRFAFEREIDNLTEAQARTLFALCTLRKSSMIELSKILETDTNSLTENLSKLREFHLFVSTADPAAGGTLEIPEPIVLMRDIISKKIADPARIEKNCAKARSGRVKANDAVGQAIGSIIALWDTDDFEGALVIASDAVKANQDSGDMWCIKGRCHLEIAKPGKKDAEQADIAFKKAMELKTNRRELVPYWIRAKVDLEDWIGIASIVKTFPSVEIRDQSAYFSSLAEYMLGKQSFSIGDYTLATEHFRQAMQSASYAIRDGRAGSALPSIREICKLAAEDYIHCVNFEARLPRDRLRVFNAVSDAFLCRVASSKNLVLGADALDKWSNDALRRNSNDPSVKKISERTLYDLNEIINVITGEESRDQNSVHAIERIYHRLADNHHVVFGS